MILKDIELRIPIEDRPAITTGTTTTSRSGKEIPTALDHFDVHDYALIEGVYGASPRELVVVFPAEQIEDFFSCNYASWGEARDGTGVMKARCDGDEVEFLTPDDGTGRYVIAAAPVAQGDKRKCRRMSEPLRDDGACAYCGARAWMRLIAFVVDPESGAPIYGRPIKFENGSVRSLRTIYSALEYHRRLGGTFIKPATAFRLKVRMIVRKAEGKQFPVWDLEPFAAGVATDRPLVDLAAGVTYLPSNERNVLPDAEPAIKKIGAPTPPFEALEAAEGGEEDPHEVELRGWAKEMDVNLAKIAETIDLKIPLRDLAVGALDLAGGDMAIAGLFLRFLARQKAGITDAATLKTWWKTFDLSLGK